MYFDVLKSSNGQYWWRIVASNGQVLAHSETYTSKQNCLHAIDIVKRYASGAQVYDRTGEQVARSR